MKVELNKKVIVPIKTYGCEFTGCFWIGCCDNKIKCNECELTKRGLAGEYFDIEEIRDIIVK